MHPKQAPLLRPEPPWLTALLGLVAKHEYLDARQLAPLLGHESDDIVAVLERLVRDSQLKVLEQPTTGARGFALTARGAKLLAELSGQESPSFKRRPQPYQLSHELAKNDLVVCLTLLDRAGGPRFLQWETARSKLADAVHVVQATGRPTRIPLVADALVVLDDGTGPTTLLVEIDMGTVSLARMRRKYEGYAA